MTYFENEAAALYVFPEKNLAVSQWKGFATSTMLREVLDKALELVTEHDIYYWLSDSRKMKVIRPSDQEYINNEWLQQFIAKNKIRKSATIESEDIFGKVSGEAILHEASKVIPFEVGIFSSYQTAVDWLGVKVAEEELAP